MSNKKTTADEQPVTTTVLARADEAPGAALATTSDGFDYSLVQQDAAVDAPAFQREDVALPFLRVAQSLTPQTKKHEAVYIPGLEEGDFFNTVTGQVFKGEDGVLVVPVLFTRSFLEFVLREQGGGFVKDYGANEQEAMAGTVKDDKGRDVKSVLRDGKTVDTHIVASLTYYVLVLDPETHAVLGPAVLALAGVQRKAARKWNALMQALRIKNPTNPSAPPFTPPMYYAAYRLTTSPDSNTKGSWMAVQAQFYKLLPDVPFGSATYAEARTLVELVRKGEVKAGTPEEEVRAAEGDDEEKVPF